MCVYIYTHVNLYIIRCIAKIICIQNHVHAQHNANSNFCRQHIHSSRHCNTLQHTATHCNTQILVNSKFTRAVFHDTFRSAHEVNTVCCSVLQCVAVCCSVSHKIFQSAHNVTQCSVLQCIVVCCSVL